MSVDSAGMAARLGIKPGMVVQELGWDEDADEDLRASIVDISGGEMLDEDTDEVADVVILWWREDDGDLVDALVDAISSLADDGVVWLLVPKSGRPGHVERGGVPPHLAEHERLPGHLARVPVAADRHEKPNRLAQRRAIQSIRRPISSTPGT